MDNRLANVLTDEPSVKDLTARFTTAYRVGSIPGQKEIAAEIYSYPPHIAAQVILNLKNSHPDSLRANALTNLLMDCYLADRDRDGV